MLICCIGEAESGIKLQRQSTNKGGVITMAHPLFAALWIIFNVAVIAVLIWGAYTLAQMRKAFEQLRKP
jgi:hypothetical protein